VAQLHAALLDPGRLDRGQLAARELEQRDRGVLAGGLVRVGERGAPGEDLVIGLSLPKKCRADSMVWQPMSSSAPPPAVSASQKCGACGPECASRARMVSTSPIAPALTIWWALAMFGENTEDSA
jgi:hypothetical protein